MAKKAKGRMVISEGVPKDHVTGSQTQREEMHSGRGKILAIDPGTKNIGIAISDPDLVMAFARPAIQNTPENLQNLVQLCQSEQINTIIVGQPMIQGQHAINDTLKSELQTKLPEINFIDFNEDFSTQDAIAELKASGASPEEIAKMKDSYAARKILENYLKS